ncbi:MAG: TolC family protein, partial [Flavobacteriaceae bacterium]|nr:TolC family protein [Flavobacteriaceae bacterium]
MHRLITILFIVLFCATQLATGQKKWTLQECIEYAFENNITVKQAELNILNADIDKSDAIGNFIPSLNGN